MTEVLRDIAFLVDAAIGVILMVFAALWLVDRMFTAYLRHIGAYRVAIEAAFKHKREKNTREDQ